MFRYAIISVVLVLACISANSFACEQVPPGKDKSAQATGIEELFHKNKQFLPSNGSGAGDGSPTSKLHIVVYPQAHAETMTGAITDMAVISQFRILLDIVRVVKTNPVAKIAILSENVMSANPGDADPQFDSLSEDEEEQHRMVLEKHAGLIEQLGSTLRGYSADSVGVLAASFTDENFLGILLASGAYGWGWISASSASTIFEHYERIHKDITMRAIHAAGLNKEIMNMLVEVGAGFVAYRLFPQNIELIAAEKQILGGSRNADLLFKLVVEGRKNPNQEAFLARIIRENFRMSLSEFKRAMMFSYREYHVMEVIAKYHSHLRQMDHVFLIYGAGHDFEKYNSVPRFFEQEDGSGFADLSHIMHQTRFRKAQSFADVPNFYMQFSRISMVLDLGFLAMEIKGQRLMEESVPEKRIEKSKHYDQLESEFRSFDSNELFTTYLVVSMLELGFAQFIDSAEFARFDPRGASL